MDDVSLNGYYFVFLAHFFAFLCSPEFSKPDYPELFLLTYTSSVVNSLYRKKKNSLRDKVRVVSEFRLSPSNQNLKKRKVNCLLYQRFVCTSNANENMHNVKNKKQNTLRNVLALKRTVNTSLISNSC